MAWQDRSYDDRIHHGGNPFQHPFLKILFGSVPIGSLFRIRLRIHAAFLWFIGLSILTAHPNGRVDTAIGMGILFGIVLLHEFGHCFAARSVGGDADNILLWPLGGLAFTDAPRRPWPQFVTVAGGPLVNLLICAAIAPVFYFLYHVLPPLNPLYAFYGEARWEYQASIWAAYIEHPSMPYVLWVYSVSWMLLFFNLIPMFPLDGGQLLQAILWKPLGYIKSMKTACYVSFFFSIPMALFGMRFGSMLLFVALFSIINSIQMLRMLKMMGPEEDNEPYDLSAAWDNPDHPARKAKIKKGWFNNPRKKAKAEQAEQAKIDAILAKVHDHGLHSLTWREKRALKKATERQRRRDLASRL